MTNRMFAAARRAQQLARDVGEGESPLSAFGHPGDVTVNATELESLGSLGGPEQDAYPLRFSQSPLLPGSRSPQGLRMTPGQQRILREAADYLRTRQPRANVTGQSRSAESGGAGQIGG
ncbi:hypothetical protein [Acrocarpospora corrugata]|uniref:hypothetical protein n=1 Tax=Acrocarpospora corrugata TaxID=35763 RepID=UPI0012D2A5D1|nr:hypothetical protein [Acrocarpospora corrugata]